MTVTRYPRTLEWWISVVRLAATAFVVAQVSYSSYSSTSDQQVAWELAVILTVVSVLLFALAAGPDRWWVSSVSMAFDFGIISAFALLYASEPGTPTRQLLLLPVVLGALSVRTAGRHRARGRRQSRSPIVVRVRAAPHILSTSRLPSSGASSSFQAGAGLIMAQPRW